MIINIHSFLYKTTRKIALIFFRNLEDAIIWGDAILVKIDLIFGRILFMYKIPKNNKVDIYNLSFPSPITFSSFKDDACILSFWLRLGIGGGAFKTIMPKKRDGNPKPRIQQVKVDGRICIINAYGLPGKGVDSFLEELTLSKLFDFDRPLGISIGGENIDDYKFVIDKVTKNSAFIKYQTYLEINISCPNTDEGQSILAHPELLDDLLSHTRSKTDKVISVKLSPDQKNENLLVFAEIIKRHNCTMVNLGNTQFRSCESVGLSKQSISRGGGGLSGPVLFKRTCEMVTLFKDQGIPIIATGGVHSLKQVNELLKLGASIVGIATGLVLDPFIIPKINRGLRIKNDVEYR